MPHSNFTKEASLKNNILHSPLALANIVNISNDNDPYYPLEYCVTSNNNIVSSNDINALKLQLDALEINTQEKLELLITNLDTLKDEIDSVFPPEPTD